MNIDLKVPHNKKLLKYVLVRLIFASIITCLLMLGIYIMSGDIFVALVISMPLIIAMSLYTSLIIVRRTKNLVDVPLSKMLEYTHVLKDASLTLIETAKNLDKRNAMHAAAIMLNEVAVSCGTIVEGCDKAAKQ